MHGLGRLLFGATCMLDSLHAVQWVAWTASLFVCVLPRCFMSFVENIRKIPRWQLGVTGGLLLWAAALQVSAAPCSK